MDIDKYTIRADWGTQFKTVAKFPLEANRIFKTKTELLAYVGDTSPQASCIPGLILAVIEDGANNGLYEVYENGSALTIRQLGYSDFVVDTVAPTTTNFIPGETYTVQGAIQKSANLFAGQGQALSTESSQRIASDASLQANIDAEASARISTDASLQEEISNLKARGKFLSLWNCMTGLPRTNPLVIPYLYNTGDYFIVSQVVTEEYYGKYKHLVQLSLTGDTSYNVNTTLINDYPSALEILSLLAYHLKEFVPDEETHDLDAASGTYNGVAVAYIGRHPADPSLPSVFDASYNHLGYLDNPSTFTDNYSEITNLCPNGNQYTGAPSTTIETEEVSINDTYYYDGTTWKLQHDTQKTVTFESLYGSPYDNEALGGALNTKENKSNKVTSMTSASTDTQYPSAKAVYDQLEYIKKLAYAGL